jgi:hypothetical protein
VSWRPKPLASCIAALPAESKMTAETHSSASAQHFVCNVGYTQKECDDEMTALGKALSKYPTSQLGEWTWVLVRSEDWKLILLTRRLDPGIPAFSALEIGTTFFEEALLAGATGRVSELMAVWHRGRVSLLDFAIRHELGHAFCNDTSEGRADRVARLLEQGKPISCKGKVDSKQGDKNRTARNFPEPQSPANHEFLHIEF